MNRPIKFRGCSDNVDSTLFSKRNFAVQEFRTRTMNTNTFV